jgi:hypothetical protein
VAQSKKQTEDLWVRRTRKSLMQVLKDDQPYTPEQVAAWLSQLN